MAPRSRRERRSSRGDEAARTEVAAKAQSLPWTVLLGVFALALLARLVVLGQLHDHPLLQPEGDLDSAVYVRLALRAAGGDWALGPDAYHVSPLYIYFLAILFRAFGPGLLVPKLLQVVLGALAAALVAATGATLFDRRVAWIAGALAALTGIFAFNEVLLLQSSLDPFLSALALLLLARALSPGSVGFWLAAGLAFGALCANRPNAALAVLALLLAHLGLRRSRRSTIEALALLLGLTLATAPFALRNRLVAGEWVWLASHGGLNFYIGNHAEADGRYRSVEGIAPSIEGQAQSARAVAEKALGRPLGPAGVSDYFYARAFEWIRANPFAAVRLLARKLLLVLNATDLALNYSFTYYRLDEPTLLRWLFVGPTLLIPLGLLGLVVRPAAGALTAWLTFVPAYAVSVALFFVASRYRLPLLVGLCVPAAAATTQLLEWARARRARPLAAAALGLSALGALTLLPLAPDEGWLNERTERIVRLIRDGQGEAARRLIAETEPRHPERGLLLYRVGRAFQDRGDLGEAIAFLDRAAQASPEGGRAVVRMSLAQALAAAGRPAEAIPHFAAARDAGVSPALAGYELALAQAQVGREDEARAELRRLQLPDDAPSGARLAIGLLAARLGETSIALATLRDAVRREPGLATAHEALGLVLEGSGRRLDGIAELEEACRLDPRNASARFNLAVLLARESRLEDARRLLREALQISPTFEPARKLLGDLGPER
jgi:tetratricopeptide (TPR) repeat protein